LECPSFRVAAGKTWLEKAEEACFGCKKCHGNFPIEPNTEQEPDLVEEIILDIQELYERYQLVGKFNFDRAGYVKGSLFLAFDKAVREVQKLHSKRMQIFLKGRLKQ
jgi:hypothetical protein